MKYYLVAHIETKNMENMKDGGLMEINAIHIILIKTKVSANIFNGIPMASCLL